MNIKLFFTITTLLFSIAAHAVPLNKIVVFGDSLSDTGNLYAYMKHQLPLSPPYSEGRFTNGPIWVERLIQHYYPNDNKQHLLDYAFGGAGVMEDEDEDGFFTLKKEMNSYFVSHQDKADADSLYVVWIGANNYLAVPSDADASVNDVMQGVQHGLQRLAEKGAKHVLVISLPDLGRTPAAREFDEVDILSYFSKRHNDALEKNMGVLQKHYPDTQWVYFDINHMLNEVMDSPEQFGFNNITDTCYEDAMAKANPKSLLKMVATFQRGRANACDGHLFFDPVHPSAPAHQIMADRLIALFEEKGITFE